MTTHETATTSATDPAYLAAKAAGQRAGDASMKAAGRKRWNHDDYLVAATVRDALLGEDA